MPDNTSTLEALENLLVGTAIVLSLVAGLIVAQPAPADGPRVDRFGKPIQPVQIVAGIRG